LSEVNFPALGAGDFAAPAPTIKKKPARLTFWPLVVATFFMVSGGTYGTEDIVRTGYGKAILILLLTPILWSLPTAFMLGELSSALPEEGGFYVWVRRALGDCWGFQEAWLSLVASVFDMAIYPTLFVLYLSRLFPWFGSGYHSLLVGVAVVAVCAALNIAGIQAVSTTSMWLFFLLSAPFAIIVVLAPFKYGALAHAVDAPASSHVSIIAGFLVAMWNYMGWDNASTIAGEVDRPQRTYPRAMIAAVAVVAVSYVLPVCAVALTHLSPSGWDTGSWAEVAGLIGGPALRIALVLGGMMSAFGMFNALVMSYSRLPYAMAQDGMLPKAFAKLNRRNVPWVSILVLATGWALCLGLGFDRLVTIDILVYGGSLVLEFLALIVLRITEPNLPRPFKIPGGLFGTILVGALPTVLLVFAILHAEHEQIMGLNSLTIGGLLIISGFVAYGIDAAVRGRSSQPLIDR
jgi:amino acid transporter